MLKNYIIEQCKQQAPRMEELIRRVTPAEHGIYPSEMLVVCAMCSHADLIVESGRQYGHSTEILARWFENSLTRIASIDTQPMEQEARQRLTLVNKPVEVMRGDGNTVVPQVVSTGVRVGVLLDGPKYDDAIFLARKISSNVEWVFIHDMRDWDLGEFTDDEVFVTSDELFTRTFAYLDETFLSELGYPIDSPGGGLAVIDYRNK